MRRAIAIAVLLLATEAGTAAGLQPRLMDGTQLLHACQDAADGSFCLGYAAGAYDAYTQAIPVYSCPPHDVTPAAVRDVVVKYLNEHPERLQPPATHLVSEAMMQGWPC